MTDATREKSSLFPLKSISFLFAIAVMSLPANAEERMLFDFTNSADATKWQIVNDGVMGGRSSGRAEITGQDEMRFTGSLSLANNGGFASVRSRPAKLSLQSGDAIEIRVRGDGRKYTFNLYVPSRRMAFSHRVTFQTKANEWTVIRLPLDRFVATSFGRTVRANLNPPEVNSVGILLGDKKPGRFEILVDWIKVVRG